MHRTLRFVLLLGSLHAPCLLAQAPLDAARYTSSGELQYPDNLDSWILMGTTLGGDYTDEPFSPEIPGSFGIVQMEPAAYRHFLEHGSYADGTMFLLSFYAREAKSEPQLQGFVQGALNAQEIHVIDSARFADGRAFFMFPTPDTASSTRLPDGNECVVCHTEHGDYNGTFVQFYPALRGHLPGE